MCRQRAEILYVSTFPYFSSFPLSIIAFKNSFCIEMARQSSPHEHKHVVLVFIARRSSRTPGQLFEQRPQRSSAMTERIFGLEIDLCHRLLEIGQIEQRIIPETARAAQPGKNTTGYCPFRCKQNMTIPRRGQNARVAGATIWFLDAFQLGKQVTIVALVLAERFPGWIFLHKIFFASSFGGAPSSIRSVSRRAHPGSAIQRSHFKARVVGNHDFLRQQAAVIDRFCPSVSGKGRLVFRWSWDAIDARERKYVHPERPGCH
jgi:hypothetical protein